jgi:hypothetical protein
VFGTLTFTRREGAILSLADSLSGDRSEREHTVILGQTAGGAYVTLLHGILTEAPLFRLTATHPCSYHATFLITGTAFDSEADMRFSLWQIRIPELNPWVGKHGFEVESAELFAGRDCPAHCVVLSKVESIRLARATIRYSGSSPAIAESEIPFRSLIEVERLA